jgi:endoglucanase
MHLRPGIPAPGGQMIHRIHVSSGAQRIRGVIHAALGCAALFLATSAVPAQTTPVERHGQLSVQGNRIVDQSGEPVVLRGMSLFWSQWMGRFYNTNLVHWLRDDWRCTVIRAALAVESGGYLTHPEREKDKIKTVIQAAIDLGIYVIIDWHDHNAHRNVAQAQAFFEEMAKTYGNHPNIIYELWNEPLNRHDWSTVIKPYHEAVIPKIRAHDPRNLIVCGTSTWSQDVDKAARDPLQFDHIAYALHFYAATHKQPLRNKAAAALAGGIAIMVTEWGTSEATGGGKLDEEETQKWLEFMDENQLSWCNWSIADKVETSAALKPRVSSTGGWSTNDLTASGHLVRNELRAKNPSSDPQ